MLPECLEMVLSQSYENKEVIVVWAGEAVPSEVGDAPGVSVVKLGRSASPAKRVNAGLRAATGALHIVLMPHCVPESRRWIQQMAEAFQDDSVDAVVSQCAVAGGGKRTLGARLLHSVASPRLLNKRGKVRDLQLVGGQADAFRAGTLARAGLLRDAAFPEPGEAVDLSVRLQSSGSRIVLSPSARVIYHDPPHTRSLGAVLRGGMEHGLADALLARMHGVDWLGSRLYAAALLSLALVPLGFLSLPLALLAALALFVWGLFLPLRIPPLHWEWPAAAANAAVFVAFVLTARDGWLPGLFEPRISHPAIVRQWLFLAAMTCSYALIALMAGLESAVRDAVRMRGRLSPPALLVLGAAWWLLSGVGFLKGYLWTRAP
ncbi:MAG: glycosyltransferase, partial [Candidatus Brocadiia bacterium]|nr:glycosyltransferase [Candidatus Brocadiia bacterium]